MTPAELRAECDRLKAECFISDTVSKVEMLEWFTQRLQSLDGVPKKRRPDRLISPKELAERLGKSVRYVYDHQDEFTFKKHLPGAGLGFSEQGLERWLKN